MSDPDPITWDFDHPCDWPGFLRRVEERVVLARKLRAEKKAHNADAHPQPPPYSAWSIFGHWMGGTD